MKTKPLLAAMAALVVMGSAVNIYAVAHGIDLSEGTGILWWATFSYVIALAVEAERKSRRLAAPFEHGALVFFAWPLIVPYYLYTLHRWRGSALGLGILVFSHTPDIASIVREGSGELPFHEFSSNHGSFPPDRLVVPSSQARSEVCAH